MLTSEGMRCSTRIDHGGHRLDVGRLAASWSRGRTPARPARAKLVSDEALRSDDWLLGALDELADLPHWLIEGVHLLLQTVEALGAFQTHP